MYYVKMWNKNKIIIQSKTTKVPWFAMDMIAIDTTDPYPTYYSGNIYIIIDMDLLTSYPEAYPIYKSADTVSKVFTDKVISVHSCPTRMLCNNGTEYKNKFRGSM